MKKIFKNWSVYEILWVAVFSLMSVGLTLYWHDSFLGFSVFLTGIICVVLVAKGNIWNYAWGTYNVLGYSYIAYNNGFFGEVMLNMGIFLPMQFIGLFTWYKHRKNSVVEMKRMTLLQNIISIVIAIVGIFIYGKILSLIAGQNNPYVDSTTTVLSVIAMILMVLRYTEQWLFWILVDIFSIILWSYRFAIHTEGSSAMILMWTFYLINAVYGYYKWYKGSTQNV